MAGPQAGLRQAQGKMLDREEFMEYFQLWMQ